MLDILETVDHWLAEERQVALATVVETWGSAPRGVGAKLAITAGMAMAGSVSGGCVEGAVIEQALESLADGRPRLLHFGVSDDQAWDVGLTCGGRISVFVEPLETRWWRTVADFARAHHPATTVTLLEGESAGHRLLFDGQGQVVYRSEGLAAESELTRLADGPAGRNEHDGQDVLVDRHEAGPHLILIGGVHVAMPLQEFARRLGFRVSLVDPRRVFASAERFPEVENILHSYPDKALPQLGMDRNTWVAVLTHDPKIDDPALITALDAPLPYISVLSSRRTHRQRLARLHAAGLTEEQTGRIRTPAGLEIGARTPEEIALSILAEIVALRNGAIA